jgi:hypothetical protein
MSTLIISVRLYIYGWWSLPRDVQISHERLHVKVPGEGESQVKVLHMPYRALPTQTLSVISLDYLFSFHYRIYNKTFLIY